MNVLILRTLNLIGSGLFHCECTHFADGEKTVGINAVVSLLPRRCTFHIYLHAPGIVFRGIFKFSSVEGALWKLFYTSWRTHSQLLCF